MYHLKEIKGFTSNLPRSLRVLRLRKGHLGRDYEEHLRHVLAATHQLDDQLAYMKLRVCNPDKAAACFASNPNRLS